MTLTLSTDTGRPPRAPTTATHTGSRLPTRVTIAAGSAVSGTATGLQHHPRPRTGWWRAPPPRPSRMDGTAVGVHRELAPPSQLVDDDHPIHQPDPQRGHQTPARRATRRAWPRAADGDIGDDHRQTRRRHPVSRHHGDAVAVGPVHRRHHSEAPTTPHRPRSADNTVDLTITAGADHRVGVSYNIDPTQDTARRGHRRDHHRGRHRRASTGVPDLRGDHRRRSPSPTTTPRRMSST